MDEDKQERFKILKGTKCETCCDTDWCWKCDPIACLGPFKDLKDAITKFRASNQSEEISEEERAKSISKHLRKAKLEEYRENRMQCDLFSAVEDKKNDE